MTPQNGCGVKVLQINCHETPKQSHELINQPETSFYKAGQNLENPACVLQLKLIYLKQESTVQAGWGIGMSYYLGVIIKLLNYSSS